MFYTKKEFFLALCNNVFGHMTSLIIHTFISLYMKLKIISLQEKGPSFMVSEQILRSTNKKQWFLVQETDKSSGVKGLTT